MYQFRLIRLTWRVMKEWGAERARVLVLTASGLPPCPSPVVGPTPRTRHLVVSNHVARNTSSSLPRSPKVPSIPLDNNTTRVSLPDAHGRTLARAKHTGTAPGSRTLRPTGCNSSTHSELFPSPTSSSWIGRYIRTGRGFINILWQQMHLYGVYKGALEAAVP